MTATGWQSSDLLARFNRLAGRPTTDAILDATKYIALSDGQESVLMAIAAVAPRMLYSAPTAMTTADGGYTWTFGTDGNGYALFPLGARVYPFLSAVPDYPWQPGRDYLDEGNTIRMPNNIAWTQTLYWQGISPPQQITASIQPVINPPPTRILIVIKAVESFAEEYLRNAALADQMAVKWEREWPKHITAMRKHLRGRGSLGPLATTVGRDSSFDFGGITW
jgi:hypothetical protein